VKSSRLPRRLISRSGFAAPLARLPGAVGPASGERVDIVQAGIAEVEFGGTVARGALVTADANGKGVAAASTNRAIGIAQVTTAAGDIAPVLIAPSVM